MSLEFIGKDPASGHGDSPTVWVDKEADELVAQGWKAGHALRAKCKKDGNVPDHEDIIRLPARMIPILREALEELEGEQEQQGG
jgi:hypothetical protein